MLISFFISPIISGCALLINSLSGKFLYKHFPFNYIPITEEMIKFIFISLLAKKFCSQKSDLLLVDHSH